MRSPSPRCRSSADAPWCAAPGWCTPTRRKVGTMIWRSSPACGTPPTPRTRRSSRKRSAARHAPPTSPARSPPANTWCSCSTSGTKSACAPNCGCRERLRQWLAGHVQVQLLAAVGVARDELLVELDAEPGLRRRDHVPRLPADGVDEHVGMKPLPALDTLAGEEVPAAGGELDIGGAHDRPAIQVWRELRSEERRVGKEGRSRWSPY